MAERDVLTDPRRGDVLRRKGVARVVIAVRKASVIVADKKARSITNWRVPSLRQFQQWAAFAEVVRRGEGE